MLDDFVSSRSPSCFVALPLFLPSTPVGPGSGMVGGTWLGQAALADMSISLLFVPAGQADHSTETKL